MQRLQEFLQEKIRYDQLNLDELIELANEHTHPDTEEYRILELALNQLLTQYLNKAKNYISKWCGWNDEFIRKSVTHQGYSADYSDYW